MKIIRNLVTLAGLSVMVFALGATGARAQNLSTNFAGTFTLPFNAQWGRTVLPAGKYSLYYGHLPTSSTSMVEVAAKDKKSPHVFILAQGVSDAAAAKSALVCIREGNGCIVRALEMPQIGQAVEFAMPRGTRLVAQRQNGSKNVQIAEGPKLIQRIPITVTK
jgi:hypothetical protein